MSQAPADGDSAERRAGNRRRDDRRAPLGRRREDALFGISGLGDTQSPDSDLLFDPGWLAAGDRLPDSRSSQRLAHLAAARQDSALVRVVRVYTAARAVIGLGLVAAQGASSLLGAGGTEFVALVCVIYAVQAISLWLLPRFGTPDVRLHPAGRITPWLSTLGVDLLFFSALHMLSLGSSFNYGALLALPVLMAGVLTPRLLALATAAAVALLLLGVAWVAGAGLGSAPALLLQAGLAGLGLFIIALLAGELAGRLAREEQAARGSMALARQQAQLNRLVIEEMADGVLVVDSQQRVRAANPAARALLVDQGLSQPAPFTLNERMAWVDLAAAVQRALVDGNWPEAGRELSIAFPQNHVRTLRMRVRFMRARALEALAALSATAPSAALPGTDATARSELLLVVLLEDVRTAQARLRQEKLAAMGRVSAGVAHEIRNPLAAIAQANALLMEEALTPGQQRLAQMVADNVERLKRLADDVMEVAPGNFQPSSVIDITQTVDQIVADWTRTAGVSVGPDGRLRCELPAQALRAAVDGEHLRRVLVNLLDNALRHASATPGAIFLRLSARDDRWAALSVFSDGLPIAPDVEPYLFEPFFSTRSRGSGLGLYICRELCQRYGGSIEYRTRASAERLRNEFVVSLPLSTAPTAVGGQQGLAGSRLIASASANTLSPTPHSS